MTSPVQQSLAGFIAGDADLSSTDANITQVRFRVGVEHWRRQPDGTYIRLENSFHEQVIFGGTAECAADLFRKGDQFVAHRHVDPKSAEPPARPAEREVPIARRIGRGLSHTAYDVTHPLTNRRQGEALAPDGTANGRPPLEQNTRPGHRPRRTGRYRSAQTRRPATGSGCDHGR